MGALALIIHVNAKQTLIIKKMENPQRGKKLIWEGGNKKRVQDEAEVSVFGLLKT